MKPLQAALITSITIALFVTLVGYSEGYFKPKQEVSFQLCAKGATLQTKQVMVYPKPTTYFEARFIPMNTSLGELGCTVVIANLPEREMSSMMVYNYGSTEIREIHLLIPDGTIKTLHEIRPETDRGRFIWDVLPARSDQPLVILTRDPVASR